MSNVNDTNDVTSATKEALQINRAPGLGKRLHKLCGALKLDTSNRKELQSLFSSETTKTVINGGLVQCEVAFSFWGFAKTDEIRCTVLGFLHWLFNPRVYMTATNSKTNFVEGIMIFSLNKLGIMKTRRTGTSTSISTHISSKRFGAQAVKNAFESWIDSFFEALQMSAGTLVFDDYLGAQMVSCMKRIYHSEQFRSNLFSEHNKDFRLLYFNLVEQNNNNNTVLQATGRHFTTNNFINIFANQQSTAGVTAANGADWNWRVLLRTPQTEHSPQLLIDMDNPLMNIMTRTLEMSRTSEDA